MLALAAKYADIISVATPTSRDGRHLLSEITMEKTVERVDRIRAAAGERFDDIELNWTITMIMITDDREQAAEMAIAALDQGFPPNIEVDRKLSVEELLNSPYLAVGTFEEIADQIRAVREKTSMSYVGIFPTQMEAFAPIIPLLAGE